MNEMAAKQEQDLSLFELASAKLSDAQKLMTEARDLLKQDLNNARHEKEAIEEITKTLKDVHFASAIKLNVGGKIYKTTLDTLRKDPDSMLCAMFSGRFELKVDEDDGAYFIDRDAELFRYILNYLRNGELLCPNDSIVKKQLLAETKFFQVQGIIDQLEGTKPSHELSSVIIKNENHYSTLMSWLPPNAACSLLYRASTDGKTPADFHRCCDNKGPTLVVTKSGEYIFGGYTSKSWESVIFKEDIQSFLFTLVNPSGSEPVKITPKPGAGGIMCNADNFGPGFGNQTYYDLALYGKDSHSNFAGGHHLGYGFNCPKNVNKVTYFTGTTPIKITELEVFKVNF